MIVQNEVGRLMRARDWRGALEYLDRASSDVAPDAVCLLHRAQCLMALGQNKAACDAADAAQRCRPCDPGVYDAIGTLFSRANAQSRALAAFEQAVALAPANAHFIFNRAAVRRFLGQLAEAEADYDRVIGLNPTDYEAYKNRSDLRTQAAAKNHIDELETLLNRGVREWRGEVQIRFALAKEHEDLRNYAKSFGHLQAGATLRRRHLDYDVAVDVATFAAIMAAYPRDSSAVSGRSSSTENPIFIIGLPRSGTTLVDRILDSHSEVCSAGELPDFALSVVDGVRTASGNIRPSRGELITRSAELDFNLLGSNYALRARRVVPGGRRFIDKMPLNYLYCGLIKRALPHAKVVLVTREPMAACYALYKTLFQDGYPFSYDLEDIGRYYVAYRRLMEHWRAMMPDSIHEVRYESLIADQRAETHKLLKFCGLEWQPACLEFHHNAAPSTTASAVQVRQPLYTSSVEQWRHYAAPLAPLEKQLRAAGLLKPFA